MKKYFLFIVFAAFASTTIFAAEINSQTQSSINTGITPMSSFNEARQEKPKKKHDGKKHKKHHHHKKNGKGKTAKSRKPQQ